MDASNLIFLIIGTAFMVGSFMFWKYAKAVPRFLRIIFTIISQVVSLYFLAVGLGVFK